MTGTYTSADDLAALDRVAVIASEAGLMSSDLAVLLERLREPIVTQQKRHRALSAALAAEWKWDDSLSAEAEQAVDRILAAIAAAGARIVWPSPEASDDPEPTYGELMREYSDKRARAAVLAEVAAVDVSGIGPGIPVDDIVANAVKLAADRFEEGGLLHLSRVNVLHAAAMLMEAAGRMGGDR